MKTRIVRLLILLSVLSSLIYVIFHTSTDLSVIFSQFLQRKVEVRLIKKFTFSTKDALDEWKEKVLHKRVKYSIEKEEGNLFVRAASESSCSAMYYKIKLDPTIRPTLSWRWRAIDLPDKPGVDDLESKKEDDFAARVYVVFPALFFANSKVLEYVWANALEEGTVAASPYSDNIKLIVLRSGRHPENEWMVEERDIYEDYKQAFGKSPGMKIGSIAFMCDADSTRSVAEAHFDDFEIFLKD